MTAVVGAVIVRDGRVLAARRSRPSALAGKWEFPGGKVEPGEAVRAALAREIAEELSVTIEVGVEIVSPTSPWVIDSEHVLRLFLATVAEGEIVPTDSHDELRWLDVEQLDGLDWLPSDLLALGAVRQAVLASVR